MKTSQLTGMPNFSNRHLGELGFGKFFHQGIWGIWDYGNIGPSPTACAHHYLESYSMLNILPRFHACIEIPCMHRESILIVIVFYYQFA